MSWFVSADTFATTEDPFSRDRRPLVLRRRTRRAARRLAERLAIRYDAVVVAHRYLDGRIVIDRVLLDDGLRR